MCQMGNPRDFMIRAAARGIAAISPEGDWNDVLSGIQGLQFMTRFSEAGNYLPTILEVVGPEGPKLALGAVGEISVAHHELDHWRRFDIIDRASAEFGASNPFHNWKSGDVFYEVVNNIGDFVLGSDTSIVGRWVTFPPGYVPIFVDRNDAVTCMQELIETRPRQAALASMVMPNSANPYRRLRTYRVSEVRDLKKRLIEYKAKFPEIFVVINPDSHRADTGIAGRGEQRGGSSRWWTETTRKLGSWVRTAAGIWSLGDENTVKLVAPAERWSGRDTFFWDGGGSLQLAESPYSLAENILEHLSVPAEMTKEDAREVAQAITSRGAFLKTPESDISLNSLVFVYWYIGNHTNKIPVRYPSIFHLIADLAGPKYTPKSDDPNEPLKTQQMSVAPDSHASPTLTRALTLITEDILHTGYSPRHAQAVIRVCNATEELGIHLEVVGYVRDILLNCNDSEVGNIQKLCNISIAEVEASRSREGDFPVHPTGAVTARERLGSNVWDMLARESRYFLATAFWDWNQRRECRFLDYATISVEISKVVEVELRGLFRVFSQEPGVLATAQALTQMHRGKKNTTNEVMIARSTSGGYKPTLGNFNYWLDYGNLESTPITNAWRMFLKKDPARDWLCSPEARAVLQRIVDKYRNGGAHDSPITIDVCREGIETIVGNTSSPGYLVRVAMATRPAH